MEFFKWLFTGFGLFPNYTEDEIDAMMNTPPIELYKENDMSEEQKLIVDVAARLMVARFENGGMSRDDAYAHQCLALAEVIVYGAAKSATTKT